MSPRTAFAATEITLAILAGGQGVRVGGQDKGLMLLGDRPLIAHVCAALRAQAGRVLICANRNAAAYARHGTVVADASAAHGGPLAGIAAALGVCETPWLLTVPVDSPAPPADLAPRLHAGATAVAASAAVGVHAGRREPLFALYRCDLAAAAQAALARDSAVWRWQNECAATAVDFPDRAADFANLNTPEDFRRWEHDAQ
jgi:molybdopterin-guanine dinucleotide biosynthesis protein A